MAVWTLMLITVLSGPLEGTRTGLLYPSEEACRQNIQTITNTLNYDYQVECIPTSYPVIRPKRRPSE